MPGKKLYVHPVDREYGSPLSIEAPPVSPSEASAGNLPPDEPNYKALYTELKGEVLEKVGPFSRATEHYKHCSPTTNVALRSSMAGRDDWTPTITAADFRALSALYDKLSSIEVFPELPSDGGSSNRSMGLNAVPSTAEDDATLAICFDRVVRQRDELLAALRGVVAIADRRTVEFDAARAAIANAEGQS